MPTEEVLQEVMSAFHITREQALALAEYCGREQQIALAETAIERGDYD